MINITEFREKLATLIIFIMLIKSETFNMDSKMDKIYPTQPTV
jgi:hypothetical protein